MSKFHHIYFGKDSTSFDFYNKILPELHVYFKEGNVSNDRLMLDFSEVDYISPLVIPNVLTVGYILKSFFGAPVSLLIPWKPKLLTYLNDVGFLLSLRKYELFNVDERLIGGYDYGKLYPGCFTYSFEPSISYEDIRFQLKRSTNIIRQICETLKFNVDIGIEEILNTITELCFNACTHSKNICFATLQTNLIDRQKHKKAYISISDCGLGLYSSLADKYKSTSASPVTIGVDEFLHLDPSVRNIYAILEAIYHRKDYKIFGLFHVVEQTILKNGIIRIHTDDTQLIFTQNSFNNYINDPDRLAYSLRRKFDSVMEHELEIKYSPVRKSVSRFKGLHIEVEVPLS